MSSLLLLGLFLLIGCRTGPARTPAIGEAFAGPAVLTLRKELSLRSPVIASVKHGERLDIVQWRHRLVKVRTSSGIEGWTDSRQLMSPEQMADLRKLAEQSARLPSQGWATVYEPLNMHIEPSRYAPSFYQIPENTPVTVIGHKVAARVPPSVPQALLPRPEPKRPKKGKEKETSTQPPLLLTPAPPKPPANWLDLSKSYLPPEEEDKRKEETEETPPKPTPMDDWSLVRTRDGKVGWVLTHPLVMGIPDDVAQYAEGQPITSFFSLSDVNDNGVIKHNWLWTTIKETRQNYEFDGFRVFVWNTNRHRYETAYRERDLVGYYPVETHPVEISDNRRSVTVPGFSVLVQDASGVTWQKTYAFVVNRVRFLGKQQVQMSRDGNELPAVAPAASQPEQPSAPADDWKDRLKRLRDKIFRRK